MGVINGLGFFCCLCACACLYLEFLPSFQNIDQATAPGKGPGSRLRLSSSPLLSPRFPPSSPCTHSLTHSLGLTCLHPTHSYPSIPLHAQNTTTAHPRAPFFLLAALRRHSNHSLLAVVDLYSRILPTLTRVSGLRLDLCVEDCRISINTYNDLLRHALAVLSVTHFSLLRLRPWEHWALVHNQV